MLKYLEESKVAFELNIVGEALKTQKNYFNKIKNLKDKINNNTNNKITFLGRQKK